MSDCYSANDRPYGMNPCPHHLFEDKTGVVHYFVRAIWWSHRCLCDLPGSAQERLAKRSRPEAADANRVSCPDCIPPMLKWMEGVLQQERRRTPPRARVQAFEDRPLQVDDDGYLDDLKRVMAHHGHAQSPDPVDFCSDCGLRININGHCCG